MKLVIQRVSSAKVSVDNNIVGEIKKGLFVLIGITHSDSEIEVIKLAEKVLNLRIMDSEKGKMNLSPLDTNCEILVVSQFTLYANTSFGRRPSFINAAKPEKAKLLYDLFIEKLIASGLKIQTGSFGKYMEIMLQADGPVTILIEE